MKSYKTITYEELCRIIYKVYPDRALPFVLLEDIPNNWLKRNGYAMRRKFKK